MNLLPIAILAVMGVAIVYCGYIVQLSVRLELTYRQRDREREAAETERE